MKTMSLAVIALLVTACASNPPKTPDNGQWINLTRPDNRVSAAIETKTGEVKFYDSPEESFKVLFGAFSQYSKTCTPTPEKVAEKKAAEKKGKK